tara:strand:- start:314 stop:727 length:414 start_codon:yes stop_codon:yes gene_type:complete
MALPSSGPLSMQDIATEFSQGSSNMSLYTFGSTLPTPTVTSNIELANDFYGQAASSCTSFNWSGQAREEPENACGDRTGNTAYHNGSGAYPVASDTVYTNSSCSTTAGAGAYKMLNGNVLVIEGESGEVSSIFTECE